MVRLALLLLLLLYQASGQVLLDENDPESAQRFQEIFDQGPFNINKPQRLLNLGLISEEEKTLLENHIQNHGYILAIEEIYSLSTELGKRLREIESEILFEKPRSRPKGSFWHRTRFKNLDHSGYIGNAFYNQSRFQFGSDRFLLAACIENDYGEKPLDYTNLSLEKRLGQYKIQAGKFGLAWGQGLLVWNQYGTGVPPNPQQWIRFFREPNLIKGSLEYKGFRGVNLAGNMGKFQMEFLFFHNPLDAKLDHPEEGGVIATIYQTGLHRSLSEIENKNSAKAKGYGFRLRRKIKSLDLESYYLKNEFSHSIWLDPERLDKKSGFEGKEFQGMGLSFRHYLSRGILAGELCRANQTFAYSLSASQTLNKFFDMGFQFIDIQARYPLFYASPMSRKIDQGKFWALSQSWHKKRNRLDFLIDGHALLDPSYGNLKKSKQVRYQFRLELKKPLDPVIRFGTRGLDLTNLETDFHPVYFYSLALKPDLDFIKHIRFSGTQKQELGGSMAEVDFEWKAPKLSHRIRIYYFNIQDFEISHYRRGLDMYRGFRFEQFSGKGASISYRLQVKTSKLGRLDLIGHHKQVLGKDPVTEIGIQYAFSW